MEMPCYVVLSTWIALAVKIVEDANSRSGLHTLVD